MSIFDDVVDNDDVRSWRSWDCCLNNGIEETIGFLSYSEQDKVNFDSSCLILTLLNVAVLLLLDDVEADRIKGDDIVDDELSWLFKPIISVPLKSNDLEWGREERSLQLACFFCTCAVSYTHLTLPTIYSV